MDLEGKDFAMGKIFLPLLLLPRKYHHFRCKAGREQVVQDEWVVVVEAGQVRYWGCWATCWRLVSQRGEVAAARCVSASWRGLAVEVDLVKGLAPEAVVELDGRRCSGREVAKKYQDECTPYCRQRAVAHTYLVDGAVERG